MSLQYVIDGYNIINHPFFLRSNKYSRDCRQGLLWLIRSKRLTGSPKNKVTVVFDGYPADDNRLCIRRGIDVIFSRSLEADEKIKMLVEESAQPKNIVVVSDDKQIKLAVRLLGAAVIGAGEFIGQDKQDKLEPVEPMLNYSQMHKINQELRKLWLK